jgi:diguanylate cyclase (GGDEF)-like protein/PAS domain S-box-containing protein
MRHVVLTRSGAAALLAGSYFLAGVLGLSLARIHESVSAVWPATGIAIAGLLLGGLRYWPAVTIGAFFVNWMKTDAASSAGIAIGNTLEALAAAWLTQRFAGGRAAFERPRTFFVFLLYGALASSMVAATIGANCLFWTGSIPSGEFDDVWVTWWLGDAVGAVLFTPLIVLCTRRGEPWTRARAIEAAVLLAGLLLITSVSFGPFFFTERHHPRAFLAMPFLIWAGFRFGTREAAIAVLLMGTSAMWCTLAGTGPFATGSGDDSLFVLQMYLGLVAGTTLTVALAANESRERAAALREFGRDLERRVQERTAKLSDANAVLANEVGERMVAQQRLAASEARFRELVESAPDAIVIVGASGTIEMVNSQTERFFGYERRELLGMPLETLVPERFRERHVADRADFMANPRVRVMGEGLELFGRRKDGSEFAVDICLSPLPTRDGLAVSASIRDVTKRKRWEQERLANESLRSQVAELSRRTKEIGTLNRMSDRIRAAASPQDVYPRVLPFLEEMFPGYSGALYMFNAARTAVDTVARWGQSPPAEREIVSDDCWALRHVIVHSVSDQDPNPCRHLPSPPPLVSMCIPMTANAQTIGLFHLRRPRPEAEPAAGAAVPVEYSDYKQKLAQAAAEQVAAAIANAMLHQELKAQAIRDPLTGLFNRRSLEESLQHELHRAQRRQTKVGVLMLDIDNFKLLNDEHGHAAGDLTLRAIAGFLERVTRKEDIVCRYGGEEILIVFVECSLVDLQHRAEHIRQGIRELALEYEGRPLGPVTVSIGAAIRPDHGTTAEELVRAADEALYRAKSNGRDRIEIAVAKPESPPDR